MLKILHYSEMCPQKAIEVHLADHLANLDTGIQS